MEVEDFTSAI